MINELDKNYNPATIDKDIREYINNVCKGILINTAVFKDNVVGKLGLDKFIGGMHL
jgi:galactose-1-phosphate uridylyltransferase